MLSGYTYFRDLTIDHTKIDSDLTDFPILVKLTSSNFSFNKVKDNMEDVRFTLLDDTLLKHEGERRDKINQEAEFWVKVPLISSTSDTVITIQYGNQDETSNGDDVDVWDSNYKMVQHLKDDTASTTKDSTSNNNHGTKVAANEPIETDGKIEKAQSFDGSNDYVNVGNIDSLDVAGLKITIEAWFKTTFTPSTSDPNVGARIFTTYRVSNSTRISMGIRNTKKLFSYFYPNSLIGISDVNDGVWHHGVVTYNGIKMDLYVDGIKENSTTTNLTNEFCNQVDLIGAFKSNDGLFNGLIDEVRISNVARSADWIATEYANQNDPGSFYTVGQEERIWKQRIKPITNWTQRSKSTTSWTKKSKPTTNWTLRNKP